jgi:O-acetyl-ADP-ribose deacetylase (regulator of RNase III)
MIKVVLVDINPRMVKAWRATFEEEPEVEVVEGSMLDQGVDAWVTPTNARASMDGGLDGVIKGHFGPSIERRVQAEIRRLHGGLLPVGHATCVSTGSARPAFLISTPTMIASSEDVSDTLNVALACAAAFQAVHMQNAREPGSIQSVALPGLGAQTGRVPVEICADLMWTGYSLFRRRAFGDFAAMRVALQEELGDLGPTPSSGKPKVKAGGTTATAAPAPATPGPGQGKTPAPAAPATKKTDVDFDDF